MWGVTDHDSSYIDAGWSERERAQGVYRRGCTVVEGDQMTGNKCTAKGDSE